MQGDRRTDEQLLHATNAGDIDAFGELFARHAETVIAYLRRRVGNAETAADLAAETFAAALLTAHRGRIESMPSGIAWLLGIARHKLIDSYRAARVQNAARAELALPQVALEDADIERIDELAGRERPAIAALEQLSEDEREAIVQRILGERDYEEIARDLGETETTIRKRVSRGLARMRQEMGAELR
jgi:RNA polymerase sigma-70 factor (ECF subfamily)